jgi:hypothetical protein
MEGLNSLLSAENRRARGYRTAEYPTAILSFVAAIRSSPCFRHTENDGEPGKSVCKNRQAMQHPQTVAL